MWECTCPRCEVSNKNNDMTKSIIGINHLRICPYMKGVPTKFSAREVVEA